MTLYQGSVTFDVNGHTWVSCVQPSQYPLPVAPRVTVAPAPPTWDGMQPPGSMGMYVYAPPFSPTPRCAAVSHSDTPGWEWSLQLDGQPGATATVTVEE